AAPEAPVLTHVEAAAANQDHYRERHERFEKRADLARRTRERAPRPRPTPPSPPRTSPPHPRGLPASYVQLGAANGTERHITRRGTSPTRVRGSASAGPRSRSTGLTPRATPRPRDTRLAHTARPGLSTRDSRSPRPDLSRRDAAAAS